jgi:MYXO-CTERM domain-containing protein
MTANLFGRAALSAAVLCIASGAASAASVEFAGAAGNRAASALFENVGGDLRITLTNTSLADVMAQGDWLTGVFFDISGGPLTLSRMSVVLAPGSSVLFGTTDAGGVVGGEFGYASGLVGAPNGAKYGVSSSGLGLFGPPDLFPGNNLSGPSSPDGPQYGITSAGDNLMTGNGTVTGGEAVIQNAVVITLGGLPMGFDPAAKIGNVRFQYGTALEEGNVPGESNVPAPGAAGLMALGALAARRKRR